MNPSFIGGEEVSELTLGVALYAARNLAVGLVFLFVLFFRNASFLFTIVLIRLITDLIDAPLFFVLNYFDPLRVLINFSVVCYLPAVVSLRYLWKQI